MFHLVTQLFQRYRDMKGSKELQYFIQIIFQASSISKTGREAGPMENYRNVSEFFRDHTTGICIASSLHL